MKSKISDNSGNNNNNKGKVNKFNFKKIYKNKLQVYTFYRRLTPPTYTDNATK